MYSETTQYIHRKLSAVSENTEWFHLYKSSYVHEQVFLPAHGYSFIYIGDFVIIYLFRNLDKLFEIDELKNR